MYCNMILDRSAMERITITLTKKEADAVREFAGMYGLNFSSAVRFIVNDWCLNTLNRFYVTPEEIKDVLAEAN